MDLPRRNGETVELALREMNKRIFDLLEKVNGLNATVSTLSTRLNVLEQELALKRAISMGHGPTA